jgi:site-specific DNA recombinase
MGRLKEEKGLAPALFLHDSTEACKISLATELVGGHSLRQDGQGRRNAVGNVVGYIRISKEEAGSTSLATQEVAIRDWCQRQGHQLVALFKDEGVSGGVHPLERPGASEAIRKARSRTVEALVVTKLDRVSRDLAATLDLVDNVLGGKATLVSISESFDAGTPAGRMFLQLLGTFAEFERNKIRERTREALQTRRSQGRKTGGHVPFGYREEHGQLIPEEAEQATLCRAFALRQEGMSWRKAADALNAEGRTRREGLNWTPSRLCDVLTSEERRKKAG